MSKGDARYLNLPNPAWITYLCLNGGKVLSGRHATGISSAAHGVGRISKSKRHGHFPSRHVLATVVDVHRLPLRMRWSDKLEARQIASSRCQTLDSTSGDGKIGFGIPSWEGKKRKA